jgi:DNA-binding MarR family transcriptional regulator
MNALATEFETSDQSTGFLLWQVTNRWQAAQRAALKPFDLTHVQFVLLASLTWSAADGPLSQKQLSGNAATDPMMTSQVLRALEKRSLVTRVPHPDDRRAHAVAVTEVGIELVNRAIGAVEDCDRKFFARLGSRRTEFTEELALLR